MSALKPSRMSSVVALVFSLPTSTSAMTDEPDIIGQAGSDAYAIVGQQSMQGDNSTVGHGIEPTEDIQPAFVDYRWVVVCTDPSAAGADVVALDCAAARVCPGPSERLYRLWGQDASSMAWVPLGTQCFGRAPTAADTPRPTVTPALVLNALRRVGLPSLEAKTQPEDRTLVNFDTIFYADARPVTTSLVLLGQDVEVEATPTSFAWRYGDGTTVVTEGPGAPFPSKQITHRYADADITVHPSVDVTYAGRFRVNGGGWQDIGETVTITGPEGRLRVTEAVAVLSGNYD